MRIPTRALTVARVASEDPARPVLNCVKVYPDGKMVATDTYMAVILGPDPEAQVEDCKPTLVPAAMLKTALRLAPKKSSVNYQPSDTPLVSLFPRKGETVTLAWENIEGVFPDYERMLANARKSEVTCRLLRVDPKLLRALCERLVGLGIDSMTVEVRGPADSLVMYGECDDGRSVVAVFAPMVLEKQHISFPAWAEPDAKNAEDVNKQ